jgi:hypothetical protein
MRGENHWRVVGILPETLRGRDGVTFEEVIPSLRSEAGADLNFSRCSWFSTYRIHHRAAERFREGRCFLLGDAAHIHSPVGAQGMNTGLQDAHNLAWKLALAVQGRADAALLDSYAAERMPVAQRLLATTDRAFQLVVSDNWLAGLFRTEIIARIAALAMRQKAIQWLAFRAVSQTDIRYRDSRLSLTLEGLPNDAPKAGDRFPWLKARIDGEIVDLYERLDDTGFNLIVAGQEAPETGLRTWVIPSDLFNDEARERAMVPAPSFYLLRPDGHVGLCGKILEAGIVKAYLSERLHMRA